MLWCFISLICSSCHVFEFGFNFDLFVFELAVSCHKGIKGEQQQHQQHGGGHFLLHDNQFRNRDVTIFDSPSLDGESFLQVWNIVPVLGYQSNSPYTSPSTQQLMTTILLIFVARWSTPLPSYSFCLFCCSYQPGCEQGGGGSRNRKTKEAALGMLPVPDFFFPFLSSRGSEKKNVPVEGGRGRRAI